jgi:hypothetical protein
MHEQYLQDLIRKLKPVLHDQAKAKVILQRFWETRMALVWTVEHVHRAANERKRVLTTKEAAQVLQTLHQQHNHQYGLEWVDLWDHLDLYEPGRKMSKAELKRFVSKDIITVQK